MLPIIRANKCQLTERLLQTKSFEIIGAKYITDRNLLPADFANEDYLINYSNKVIKVSKEDYDEYKELRDWNNKNAYGNFRESKKDKLKKKINQLQNELNKLETL